MAHRLLYHSTLGCRVIKKKKNVRALFEVPRRTRQEGNSSHQSYYGLTIFYYQSYYDLTSIYITNLVDWDREHNQRGR